MLPTKIVVIGAGSASFGLNTVSALFAINRLRGSQIALVDRNPANLDLIARLAERLNREWGAGMHISAHRQHRPALTGAEFVISAIEVPPREELWRKDYEITLKYGVRQPYAENGGPGGFAHAARNIAPVMEIIHEMEKACPQAWFINFSNPMIRICDAIHRYSNIKVVGLCHQIFAGYGMVAYALAHELGIDVPAGKICTHAHPDYWTKLGILADQAVGKVDIKAAGLNHFTWMLDIRSKTTGEDLYPLLEERWSQLEPEFEPLTSRVFQALGLFPIPGDEHLCEYLPWVSDVQTQPWEKYELSLYDWDLADQMRISGHAEIARMGAGESSIESLRSVDSEGAVEVVENLAGAGEHYHLAVNLPNTGQIANLPPGAIVETPAMMNGAGIQPLSLGALPEPVAELCRREITVAQLCVDAAIHGDRQAALQCLLLDPVITDLDVARLILDDYLQTYREYLPQFWN